MAQESLLIVKQDKARFGLVGVEALFFLIKPLEKEATI